MPYVLSIAASQPGGGRLSGAAAPLSKIPPRLGVTRHANVPNSANMSEDPRYLTRSEGYCFLRGPVSTTDKASSV